MHCVQLPIVLIAITAPSLMDGGESAADATTADFSFAHFAMSLLHKCPSNVRSFERRQKRGKQGQASGRHVETSLHFQSEMSARRPDSGSG